MWKNSQVSRKTRATDSVIGEFAVLMNSLGIILRFSRTNSIEHSRLTVSVETKIKGNIFKWRATKTSGQKLDKNRYQSFSSVCGNKDQGKHF